MYKCSQNSENKFADDEMMMEGETKSTQVAVRDRIIKFDFNDPDDVIVLVHDGLQASLLQTFYQSPKVNFTLIMLADNLKHVGLLDLEKALESLVDVNLVERHNQQGTAFFKAVS